jgi:hypothetical protein
VMQLQAETVFLCTLYELKASSFLPSGSYDKGVWEFQISAAIPASLVLLFVDTGGPSVAMG